MSEIKPDDLLLIHREGVDYSVKAEELVGPVHWDDIEGKPDTYPPEPHTHSYENLTDKPITISYKEPIDPPNGHIWVDISQCPPVVSVYAKCDGDAYWVDLGSGVRAPKCVSSEATYDGMHHHERLWDGDLETYPDGDFAEDAIVNFPYGVLKGRVRIYAAGSVYKEYWDSTKGDEKPEPRPDGPPPKGDPQWVDLGDCHIKSLKYYDDHYVVQAGDIRAIELNGEICLSTHCKPQEPPACIASAAEYSPWEATCKQYPYADAWDALWDGDIETYCTPANDEEATEKWYVTFPPRTITGYTRLRIRGVFYVNGQQLTEEFSDDGYFFKWVEVPEEIMGPDGITEIAWYPKHDYEHRPDEGMRRHDPEISAIENRGEIAVDEHCSA